MFSGKPERRGARCLAAAALTGGVLLAAAGSAQAANVHAVSTHLPYCFCVSVAVTYTAAPGEGNHVTAHHSPSPVEIVLDQIPFPLERPRDLGTYTITDTVPLTVSGDGCSLTTPYVARCGAGGGISGNLGDRNDSVEAFGFSFSGGTGDDRLTGSGRLTGADGNDHVEGTGELRGGNGNDYIVSGGGTVFCGAGTDVAVGRRSTFSSDCETKLGA